VNITGQGFDPQALRNVWTQVCSTAPDALADVEQQFGVDFANAPMGTWGPEGFHYTPVTVVREDNGGFTVDHVVFALSDRRLVTSQPAVPFPVFNSAIMHMRLMPELAFAPHGVMYALLHAMSETSRQALTGIQAELDALGEVVSVATRARRPEAILTAESTLWRMVQIQRQVTQALRAQASLIRAARRLYFTSADPWLLELAESLQAELNGLKEETTIEYDMLRFLRQLASGLLANARVGASMTVGLVVALSLGFWCSVFASALFPAHDWVPIVLGWGVVVVLISLGVVVTRGHRRSTTCAS
jgi:Mg2+ and Co2+ transporter CorA